MKRQDGISMVEVEQLRYLVKQANTRLRALEKTGTAKISNAYNWVVSQDKATGKAYDTYQSGGMAAVKSRQNVNDLFTVTKKGEIKFRTDISHLDKKTFYDLKRVVTNFINAKTSTTSGAKEVDQKIRDALKDKIKNPDPKYNYRDAFNTSLYKRLRERGYDSEQALQVVHIVHSHPSKFPDKVIDELLKQAPSVFIWEEASMDPDDYEPVTEEAGTDASSIFESETENPFE